MYSRALSVVVLFLVGSASAPANWQWVNLHPAGASTSWAIGVDKFQESGFGSFSGQQRAGLWGGTAASWVSLHPASTSESWSWGVSGGVQVGYAKVGALWHAALWTGSAGSWVDLHPGGNGLSIAYDVAGGQQVGVVANRAALWTGTSGSHVNLHPAAGSATSVAFGTDGTRQVGYVDIGAFPKEHASLWSGTAASWVDLHVMIPTSRSVAWGIWYSQQAGYAVFSSGEHAIKWSGTPASWIDLHPSGASSSIAYGTSGGYQAGVADFFGVKKAALWSGTAASYVDLHAVLPAYYWSSEARGIWAESKPLFTTIRVVGWAYNTQTNRTEAILWHRTIPRPVTWTVAQVAFEFSPSTLRVRPGDVVQWTWTDGDHTVTSGAGCQFDQTNFDEPLNRDYPVAEFVVPAGVAEIPYFCRPHCGMGMTGLLIVESPVLVGDLNCDGNVDFGDINPFVLALTNPPGYHAAFPNCDLMNADINADGKVDFGDINPFVRLLTGP